jgi:hypothetical protein
MARHYKQGVHLDPNGNVRAIVGNLDESDVAEVERQRVIERTEDNCWFGNDLYG